MLSRETRVFNFDPINQRRLGVNPIKITHEELELSAIPIKDRPVKSVTMKVLFMKKAIDTFTLEQLVAYFITELKVEVLSDATYAHQYLTICDNRAWVHNLDSGQSTSVCLSAQQEGLTKKFGVEKRLTNEEAEKMLDEGLPCFEKVGSEWRMLT